jgi:Uma2 family endonuclease
MIDCGIFREDERLELLDGALVVREPQGDPHAAAVDLAVAALRQAFGPGWLIRAHAPLALGRRSRPEPDVSVVQGTPRDYRNAAPTNAALVLEVSQTSLSLDRTRKATIYARAGIPDYWIVNLVEQVLEVRGDPAPLEPPRHRWAYRSIQTLQRGESVAPLGAPDALIAVADLLP